MDHFTARLAACTWVLCLPSVVAAQDPASAVREFRLGGALLRCKADGSAAAVARAGDRFAPLPPIDGLLHLRAGTFDPLRAEPTLAGGLAAPADGRLFAVQFATAIVPEYRAALLAAGLEVVGYWPSSAYLVRGDRAVALALASQPWVRWVGDVAVGYKLEDKTWPLVAEPRAFAAMAQEYSVVLTQKSDRARLAAAIAAAGGEVTKWNDGSTLLNARLTPLQLASVAALDTVLWIDGAGRLEYDLNNARIQGGANTVEFSGGITGTGVRVHVLEGLEETHPDWTLTPLVQFDDNTDPHGHCTGMIIGGNGSGNTNARGILPNCQVIEAAASVWLATQSRYQVTQAALDPAQPWRVMQQTASWGYATTTDYTSASQELDDVLFAFDLATTQSQSNSGTTSSRPQAWAKNVIAVGGVYHRDNSDPADDVWRITGATPASIGPASDGRIKPDVCCYYDNINCGDLTGLAGYSVTNYTTSFGGTSGATPIVNGYVGLIQQMCTDGLFGNALPMPPTAANRFANRRHMTTTKALLCNTAASYAFSGAGHDLARTHQGWGFPDVARLYQNRDRVVAVDEYDVLQQGQTRTYFVWLRPGTAEFRATMTHADPPALPSAAIHRVNSLDLQVRRLDDGTTWWGNRGLDVGNSSVAGGVADDRNTLENVWLPNPLPGLYSVSVAAPTIVADGHPETVALDVDFALCMHPMGGGYRAPSTIGVDAVSAAPGDLRVQTSGVPASGWTEGYTLVSLDTSRPFGFGNYFGLEGDQFTEAVMLAPSIPGDVFHFPNAGAGHFPFTPYVAPVPLAHALHGVGIDVVLVLLNGSQVFHVTNLDRVVVQ